MKREMQFLKMKNYKKDSLFAFLKNFLIFPVNTQHPLRVVIELWREQDDYFCNICGWTHRVWKRSNLKSSWFLEQLKLKWKSEKQNVHHFAFNPGADRPGRIPGVSRCALCTNVAPGPVPQTKNNFHFIVLYQNWIAKNGRYFRNPVNCVQTNTLWKKAPCPC